MSNFEGVQKNANSFKPKGPGEPDVLVVKTAAGGYEQGGVQYLEPAKKANTPTLPPDPAPDSGHRGEKELGVSVDRVDRDGGAEYVDVASMLRQTIAQLSGVSGSHKAISELSALADQLEGKSVSSFVHKSANHVQVECPHCHGANRVERSTFGGLQKITCGSCGKGWQQDISLSTFTKSTNPDIAALRKQLLTLTERIRAILAQRAGVLTESSRGGDRFMTKSSDPQQLIKEALQHGVSVPFSGADPRTEVEKTSGKRFQPR